MMAMLPKEQLERGVVCSSAGNHAQGVALAAKRLGCNAVIVMPITTPEIKWKSVKRLRATVLLIGDSYDEAQEYAKMRARKEGQTFVPPFDHPDAIMGQGTVGMEIFRQIKDPLHAIFVPIGGGRLIAGIATYVKRVSPKVKVIGVEPSDANSMALSLHHGQRVMLDKVGGFADGVAVKVIGEENFRLCKELIDGVIFEELAEKRFQEKDMLGAKRLALRAKTLYPSLEGLPGFLGALDIYIAAYRKINGEVDWCGVLGVDPSADVDIVRKNYRKLALTLHPDKNQSVGANGAFKILSQAWSLLSDKGKIMLYDQKRNNSLLM